MLSGNRQLDVRFTREVRSNALGDFFTRRNFEQFRDLRAHFERHGHADCADRAWKQLAQTCF